MSDSIIHISFATMYQYEGWIFEYGRHKPIGPWPLKKDLEPRKRAGEAFYNGFYKFLELSEEEQDKYIIKY